jgi:hypothetical protein
MPIERKEGESRDEFVSRCVSKEMNGGMPQDQALAVCLTYADEYFKGATKSVTDNTWSTEAPINVNLKSYRDYPKAASENAKVALRWAEENGWGTCGTPVGKARANQLANGEPISEETIARMAAFERHRQNSDRELGEGCGRLMWLAWGGDEGIEWAGRKLRQIQRQDNFSSQKKVIFNEDFNEEDVKKYKDLGFKVYIRSERKIKKKDKKTWNKLKVVGLSEDNLVFGELKDLNKKYEFDLLLTGQDPILEALLLKGQELNLKNVISSYSVDSIEDAKLKEKIMLKSVDLKFVTVKVLYTYEEIPGIPAAASGSRNFCKRMLSNSKAYSLDEISNLPNEHLKEMFKNYNLQPDVFQYRGGFYRLPGTLNTTPWCRHYWKANVVVG